MTWFLLAVLPCFIMWMIALYQKLNLEEPIDNIWTILWCITGLFPIVNLIVMTIVLFVVGIGSVSGDIELELKETKLNRFLFGSKAREWDREREREAERERWQKSRRDRGY